MKISICLILGLILFGSSAQAKTIHVAVAGLDHPEELLNAMNEQGKPLVLTFVAAKEGETFDFRLSVENGTKKDPFGFSAGNLSIAIQHSSGKVIGITTRRAGFGSRNAPYKAAAADIVKRMDKFIRSNEP